MDIADQCHLPLPGFFGEALRHLLNEFAEVAGAALQGLYAVLVAREVEQIVDQLHQAMHFLVDGTYQLLFASA